MFKKMSKWLEEHVRIWRWDEKDGALHLIGLIFTPILMFLFFFLFEDVTLPFQLLFGLVSFVPLIIEGARAIVTKTKFNPLYWFSLLLGVVIGGIIACGLYYLIFCI